MLGALRLHSSQRTLLTPLSATNKEIMNEQRPSTIDDAE
jgi:hypothetical protein